MIITDFIFPFDYIILTVCILIIIISTIKGFIHSLLSLLTWIGAILISIYTYESLSDFITKQILNIVFFQNNEYFISVLSIIISIPVVFIISLFILKRIRTFLNSNLDHQIFGLIFDKIFGLIYGILFSYILITATITSLDKFNYNKINSWLIINSSIIKNINNFNHEYIFIIKEIDKENL